MKQKKENPFKLIGLALLIIVLMFVLFIGLLWAAALANEPH